MTTDQQQPRRRRIWLLVGIPILVAGLLIYIALPGKNVYTVSPETTYATDHVQADGFVDNVAALNSRLRGDITPERNANVHIWQAIGPHPEGGTMPAGYFEWLGVPAPPEKGEYMQSWTKFLKAKREVEAAKQPAVEPEELPNAPPGALPPPPPAPGAMDADYARQERARKWPWAAADEPDLAAWVAKNEKPLAAFAQATTKPDYYNPLVPRPGKDGRPGQLIGCLLPNVQVCREAANLLTCRAMMRLGAGKTAEAWQDLLTCHRLGRVMMKGGTMIEYLVGVAIQAIAMHGETVFLSQAKLSPAQLAACRADLLKLPALAPLADKLDLTERLCSLDIIQWVARDGLGALKDLTGPVDGPMLGQTPPAGRLFSRSTDWNVAMRLVNARYDRTAAAMRLADPQARETALADLEAEIKVIKGEVAPIAWAAPVMTAAQRGDLYGKLLVCLTMPAVAKMAAAEVRSVQQHRNLEVAFALAAHRADHGKYPATLAELAPKYLPEVPKDLYTGEGLKYKPAPDGFLLYSVGENKKDDAGRGRWRERDPSDLLEGDDWGIEMPVKKPEPPKPVKELELPLAEEIEDAPKEK